MQNFNYYSPTRIVFGKGTESKVGELIKEQGCKKVLVHYGSGSVVRSGLLDRVYASLDAAGVDYVSLGGVVPNPRLSKALEGAELAKKEGVDFILAVGGGSVIDSAKCIGYALFHPDIDVWKFYEKKETPKGCVPVGVVLTLSATGSETSNSSVITKEEGWLKRGAGSEYSRPRFAVMNPELTYTLPPYQTASGAVDILMHTMERYFQQTDTMEITRGIAEALLRDVMKYTKIALADPENYEARAEIMWCGSLSHIDMTELGGTHGDWSCHQLEHELGGMFDVAHGAGLGAIWATWARYVYKDLLPKFVRFATEVMGVEARESDEETALAGFEAFEEFLRDVNMPTNLRELLGHDITEEQIKELAWKCSRDNTRTIGGTGVKALDLNDMEEIFRQAR